MPHIVVQNSLAAFSTGQFLIPDSSLFSVNLCLFQW